MDPAHGLSVSLENVENAFPERAAVESRDPPLRATGRNRPGAAAWLVRWRRPAGEGLPAAAAAGHPLGSRSSAASGTSWKKYSSISSKEAKMAGNSAFQLAQPGGWSSGLRNLLRADFGKWFKTRMWWTQALIWVAVIDGILFSVLRSGGEEAMLETG
jgi:hypothetical protein